MMHTEIALTDTLTAMIVVTSVIFIMSFIIGRAFRSFYFYFIDIMIIVLISFCSLYSINKELKIREYYKFHIGYISCDEYYRRHLYHTGWHVYGQPGMTVEELMKYIEENKENEIIDSIILKEKAPK